MNPKPKASELVEQASRRVLVVLDSSSRGDTAFEAAADLAVELDSELRGLFVEDESLVRLASLPFAQETLYSSASQRQLDLTSLDQILGARAELLRRKIAARAARLQIKWSFDVVRGRMVQRALAAALEADLLLITREQVIPAPLVRNLKESWPILVLYEDTATARRVLFTAAKLVQDTPRKIVVLIATSDPQQVDRVRKTCETILQEMVVSATVDSCCVTDKRELATIVGRRLAKLVLLGRDSQLFDEAAIEWLADLADCPVGLVC